MRKIIFIVLLPILITLKLMFNIAFYFIRLYDDAKEAYFEACNDTYGKK